MREVFVSSFETWREAARRLLAEGVEPEEILWREPGSSQEAPTLFDAPPAPQAPAPDAGSQPELRVPRAFLELARAVAPHSDPSRWTLLYSVLFRLAKGDHGLMLRRDEPQLRKLRVFAEEAASLSTAAPGAAAFVPKTASLEDLQIAARSCQGCDLYRHATQTVFGLGPATARAVFVGEQPGDQEDIQGAPFVGPAGEVLDRALVDAGIPRKDVYVTNVVKHFKFVRTPRRRIHQTPGTVEIGACRPWLDAELAAIRPEILVCLGATASKALLGPSFRLMQERGRFLDSTLAPRVLATLHPSAVLRAEDKPGQDRLYGFLRTDLALVAAELSRLET